MSEENKVYTAWLIEKDSPAKYWKQGSRNDVSGSYNETWTSDAHEALSFPTKEQAEMEMENIISYGVRGDLRVADHMFNCRSS